MNLPKLQDFNLTGKKVLVRADLDIEGDPGDGSKRLRVLLPTLKHLGSQNAKIILMGHKGRPGGKVVEELSLTPAKSLLEKETGGVELELLENLRFNPGEEGNSEEFAKQIAAKGDFYVNEAFGTSHRKHASIVSVPKLLPHAAGLHFQKEVENLESVLNGVKRPVLFIISGVKDDKITYIEPIKKYADKVLIGGRLPEFLDENLKDPKLVIAKLLPDKEDITLHSVETFEREIAKAGTIVVSGPPGKYEDEGHRQGTDRVFRAVVASSAFKVAGGGDTQKALSLLGLEDAFDWVSVGGGAMLDFLADGTLPGIEALLN